jgi:hypothetical protein
MNRFRKPLFVLMSAIAFVSFTASNWQRASALDGPALTIDAAANNKPISPYIYGMNWPDAALQAELSLPQARFGGNRTTRYDWLTNTSGAGADWFFENRPEPTAPGQTLPNGSWSDQFVDANNATGTKSLLTVPILGWRTKDSSSCSFSVAKYGAQQFINPNNADCGNGRTPAGAIITGNDPTDAHIATAPSYYQAWIQHLVNKYGTAATTGVKFYSLDNEPDLWHETHRDVSPTGASFAEWRDKSIAAAAVIKSVDPSAQTLGVVGFGWLSFRYSGKDKQTCDAQGQACWDNPPDAGQYGSPAPWFTPWFLQQMKAYEVANGTRLLDYLDIHMYPQAYDTNSQALDPATQALRFRSVKGLWDPTYVDESWINTAMYFIPRMKQMIADNYPGTKTAITEYNFGVMNSLNGALVQADTLGVFGREGLDLANIWDPPTRFQPGAYAFRMYLNYNGVGGKFGDVSVSAASGDQDKVSVYAAKRTSDNALTIMVINKDPNNEYTSPISLAGFNPGTNAKVYRYSAANLNQIQPQADQPVTAAGFTATFPAYSATLFVIPPSGGILPTDPPTLTPTITLTPSLTNTPSPVGAVKVLIKRGDENPNDNSQRTDFNFRVTNTSSAPVGNIQLRLYYTAEGNYGPAYTLEKWYDESGVAVVSPNGTQHAGDVYYITVDYGNTTLAPGASWTFATTFHISNWSTGTYNSGNDWWHTGYPVGSLPADYEETQYLPVYNNGVLIWGQVPPVTTPTATPTATASNTPGGPTDTPSPTPTNTATPTQTGTPAVGAAKAQIKTGDVTPLDNNQRTDFNFRIVNTSATPLSNLVLRLYYTAENGYGANYVLEKWFDESGAAVVSPTGTLAFGNVYYITVNYGSAVLPAGAHWAFSTTFHLNDWSAGPYNSGNDWWHTGYAVGGLPADYEDTQYLALYNNGGLIWGSVPTDGTATPTATITPSVTNTPQPPRADTVGAYQGGMFYLRNTNTTGVADIVSAFGDSSTDLPVAGDWNGDGVDTIGVYRATTGFFFLSDSNTAPAVNYTVLFGNPGDAPFAGRWDNTMTGDGIGVYRNSNGILYQKKQLATGFDDFFAIFGNPGDKGIAGDWEGNGFDSIGIYRASDQTWFLSNNSTPSGIVFSDINFVWDIWTNAPVTGDWDGTNGATAGYFNGTTGVFALHPSHTTSGTDNVFAFGPAGSLPVAGRWTSGSRPPVANALVNAAQGGYQNGNTDGESGD